jgi:hypothetical protein
MNDEKTFAAFVGDRLIASGDVKKMLRRVKARFDRDNGASILIFENDTGKQVDFDLRGSLDDVLARLPDHPLFAAAKAPSGPGRPKLGVVSREVSLLPRHWEWLEQQPNGISAALRKLVDEARKRDPAAERARLARDAASRFMTAMAGNLPDYEEASRAFFARDAERFDQLISAWPKDIRAHVLRMAEGWLRTDS